MSQLKKVRTHLKKDHKILFIKLNIVIKMSEKRAEKSFHVKLQLIQVKDMFGANSICYQRPKAGYET
jgi:hypothetical protein